MKKHSWIVALLVALSFTGFLVSCGVDAIPPKPLTITVGTDPTEVTPEVVGGAVSTLDDGTGYEWSRSASYQGSYAYFQIDKKLTATSTVEFTITGSGGDVNYKKLAVYVADDADDFSPADDGAGGLGDGSDWGSAGSGYGSGTQVKKATVKGEGKKPYVCIYVHAPDGKYEIKNITITP